jgi:hypothetical protein
MGIWVALVAGIIVGWVAEWLLDWFYWRRGVEAFYITEAELRRQVDSLAAENESLRNQLAARPGAVAQNLPPSKVEK